VSDLKVNFNKSKIEGIGIDYRVVDRFSEILNCSTMEVLFKYLGVPVGANYISQSYWKDMVNKVKKRLALCKGKHISFVGKVSLIKFVISTIFLYYLSSFKISVDVNKEIRRIERDFLWGWGYETGKIAWVKWDNMGKPKSEGGLEIKDLKLFNMTLFGKRKWKLGRGTRFMETNSESKYGYWKGLDEPHISSQDS